MSLINEQQRRRCGRMRKLTNTGRPLPPFLNAAATAAPTLNFPPSASADFDACARPACCP